MRNTRTLLFLIGVMCALPLTSHAQWGIHYVQHDWRVTMGGDSYGITQEFTSFISPTVGTTTTTFYLGKLAWHIDRPAVWVVGIPLLGLAGIGICWELFRKSRKR